MATASTISSWASEVYYGSTCMIMWSASNSSYTHKVEYSIGDYTFTESIAAGTSKHTKLLTTEDDFGKNIANQITGKSGTMIIRLYTYDGNKKIGSHSVSVKIIIDENDEFRPAITKFIIVPYVDEKIKDVFGEVFIKGHSRPIFSDISANGGLGSEIKSYVITDNFSSHTYKINDGDLPYTGDVIYKGGEVFYYAQSKNTRGYLSDALQVSVNVQNYYAPIVDSFTVKRNESDSASAIISFNCTYADIKSSDGDSANSASIVLAYQAEDSKEWVECGTRDIASGENVEIRILKAIEESLSYNFKLTVTDLVGESTVSTVFLPRYSILLHYPANQKGFGIGKYVENDGHFEVGFPSDFYENVNMKQNLEVDGLITGTYFGRDVYSGENIINTSKSINSKMNKYYLRAYVINPFNLVYFRMRINGLTSVIEATSSGYETLLTLKSALKPAFETAFATSGGVNCDIKIDKNGVIGLRPYSNVTTGSDIYISGVYPLDSSSPLYIQNVSRSKKLD